MRSIAMATAHRSIIPIAKDYMVMAVLSDGEYGLAAVGHVARDMAAHIMFM